MKEFILRGRKIVVPDRITKARLKRLAKVLRSARPTYTVAGILQTIASYKDPIVICLDLRHAFDSVTEEKFREMAPPIPARVQDMILREGLLPRLANKIGSGDAVPVTAYGNLISALIEECFYEGHLPQGYPTSPILFEYYMLRTDIKMFGYVFHMAGGLEQRAPKYLRYVDNIYIVQEKTKSIYYYKTLMAELAMKLQGYSKLRVNFKKSHLSWTGAERAILGRTLRGGIPRRKRKHLQRKLYSLTKQGEIKRAQGVQSYLSWHIPQCAR